MKTKSTSEETKRTRKIDWEFNRIHIYTLERLTCLNAIKTKITFLKGQLNFSSKSTTAVNVYLLLDNWLKNNHISIDIYYLCRLLVSDFFVCFSFQSYSSITLILEGAKTLWIKWTQSVSVQTVPWLYNVQFQKIFIPSPQERFFPKTPSNPPSCRKFQLSLIHFFNFLGLTEPPMPRKFQSCLWGEYGYTSHCFLPET